MGAPAARAQFCQVGRDPRPVMRAAYDAFKQGSGTESIVEAAGGRTDGGEAFYALLVWVCAVLPSVMTLAFTCLFSRQYSALYKEAQRDTQGAEIAMKAAVATPYALRSNDYMAALAQVHMQQRGWSLL